MMRLPTGMSASMPSSTEHKNENNGLHDHPVQGCPALKQPLSSKSAAHLSAMHGHMDPRLPSNGRHSPQRLPSGLQDWALLQMHLQILLHL